MSSDKQTAFVFNPRDRAFRRKLWIRLQSKDGHQIYIFWSRIAVLLCVLGVTGWLSLSAAAWGFVKFKRHVEEVSFIDIAFYPLRAEDYRATLSRHYLKTAKAHLKNGAWSKAVFNLRLSIAKDRKQREARRMLADIYSQIQRTDLAIQILDQGLAEATDDADYLRRLLTLLRREKEHQRIIDLGLELLPASPDKNKTHQEVVYQAAQAYLDLGQGERAKEILSAWSLDRTLRGQLFLSDVDQAQGYPQLAIMKLEALHQRTKNDQIILKLIPLYREAGRLEDARRIALLRVFLHPKSSGARIDLITLLHATNQIEEMESEFANYLESFAEDQRALSLLSSAVINFPRPDMAIQIRETAPKNEDGLPPVFYEIAVMQAQCARQEYQNALKTSIAFDSYPQLSKVNRANINLMKAWASYGLDEPLKGDTWIKLSLSEDYGSMVPDTFLLVNRLRDMNQPDNMRRVLLYLMERSQGNPLPLITLARHDIETAQWKGVVEYLPQLFQLDPEPTLLLKTISHELPEEIPLSTELRAKLDLYY